MEFSEVDDVEQLVYVSNILAVLIETLEEQGTIDADAFTKRVNDAMEENMKAQKRTNIERN